MAGVAVNVTLVPAQIVMEGLAIIETLAGKSGFTVIVIIFDVAGFPVAQTSFEVKIQVTAFPFANVVLENVGEFVPTFTPLIFH